jgi:hypothetical protein
LEVNMSRSRRAWWWVGGVWLVLVTAGGGATLVLQPGGSSPGDGSRGERSPRTPAVQDTALPEDCKDEEATARRRAEREGTTDYSFVCITIGQQGP